MSLDMLFSADLTGGDEGEGRGGEVKRKTAGAHQMVESDGGWGKSQMYLNLDCSE